MGKFAPFLFLVTLLMAATEAPPTTESPAPKRSSFSDTDITIEADTITFTDEGRMLAEGHVVLTSGYGVLKTEYLTYDESSKSVEVQQGFDVDADVYRFHGEQLKLNVEQKKGSFINAGGSYEVPEFPGVKVFFHSLRGFMEGDSIRIEDVRVSNFEPPEKAGAFLRVNQAIFYRRKNRDYLTFRRMQVFLFGQKLFSYPSYTRALGKGQPRALTLGPILRYHKDSSWIVGAAASYPFIGNLRLGGAYEFSLKKDHLPSASLFTSDDLPFKARVDYGKEFVINEFGEGSVIRFEPAGSASYRREVGNITLNLGAGDGHYEEEETGRSGNLQWVTGGIQKRLASIGNLSFHGQTDWTRQVVTLDTPLVDSDRGKTRWISRAWAVQKFGRGQISLGYLTADKHGSMPFNFLSTRERDTVFSEAKYRLTPKLDLGYELEFDFTRRNFYRDVYELGYHYHGLVVHVRHNPRLGGVNVYFSVEGL